VDLGISLYWGFSEVVHDPPSKIAFRFVKIGCGGF